MWGSSLAQLQLSCPPITGKKDQGGLRHCEAEFSEFKVRMSTYLCVNTYI